MTIYPNPRAVARAICDKIGVVYDAPTESQENNRSRRSRRPPKRFVTPQTPKELKKKSKQLSQSMIGRKPMGRKPMRMSAWLRRRKRLV